MRVDHAQVERRQEHIRIRQRNERRPVNRRVALVHLARRLVCVTRVIPRRHERRVRQVELRHPSDELRRARSSVSHVRVVGANGLAGRIPGEVHLTAGEGQRLGAVARDGWAARVPRCVYVDAGLVGGDVGAGGVRGAVSDGLPRGGIIWREAVRVGLVHDVQGGEVLPRETGRVLRAGADVRREVSPGPGLGDASLEPDGHGVQAEHLAEGHLLAGLGGDGLREEVCDLAAVEVGEEAPYAGLAPAGELLVEVDELTDGAEGVVVGALGGSRLAEHVGEESGVAHFLDGHELDVGAVLGGEAGLEEVLLGEDGKTVVEEVELDPFLIQTESDGFVVEVAVYHVSGLSPIGSKTAYDNVRCWFNFHSWISRLTIGLVGNWCRVLKLAIGIVVGCRRVRRQRSNGSSNGSRCLYSSSGSRGTRVRSMAGGTSHIRAPSRRC